MPVAAGSDDTTATTAASHGVADQSTHVALAQQQDQRYFMRVPYSPIYRRKTFKWSHTKLLKRFGSHRPRRGLIEYAVDPEAAPHWRRYVNQYIVRHGATIHHDPEAYVHPPTRDWMDRVEEIREGRDIAAHDPHLLPRASDEHQRWRLDYRICQCTLGEEQEVGKDLHDLCGLCELFDLGIHFDNEHEQGPRFTLDTILHDAVEEPLYAMTVRDSHRHYRRHQKRQGAPPPQWHERSPETAPTDPASDAAVAALVAEESHHCVY
ncbi:hypothetical protein PLIIFM63780_010629 [Purpureocillium lilacinum]|nr:hypothetical protein PLIIFM63780_010629 [Purpureocillium lilacinum]